MHVCMVKCVCMYVYVCICLLSGVVCFMSQKDCCHFARVFCTCGWFVSPSSMYIVDAQESVGPLVDGEGSKLPFRLDASSLPHASLSLFLSGSDGWFLPQQHARTTSSRVSRIGLWRWTAYCSWISVEILFAIYLVPYQNRW